MKYGIWKVAETDSDVVATLCTSGYSVLTAHVLSSRGITTAQEARAFLNADAPLIDPFEMREMDRAVAAVREALSKGHTMAVFGDYDVDGITATCLLTDYLRSLGAKCLTHIPGRIEEGYGLNEAAILQLHEEGVRLIITVDCGITAVEEAELCRRLGITLVITDHHECKQELPKAAAIVDPHRPDRSYPHTDLSGVGIAFKLVAALDGNQERIAERYSDLFCLGTIADVMPLRGENRRLVVQGLESLQQPRRLGIRALSEACECDSKPFTAATIGYVLAPRINAAGRMEHAELAVELFLTRDLHRAKALADRLCRLNRERQNIEMEIHREAAAALRSRKQNESAIVLAGENWHQGVVGIVASRICEEHHRPTFLICLNGEHGKASSRSYGGFNLFASLQELSYLLDGYGGHELAAGFTIPRSNIEEFRQQICKRVEQHTMNEPDGSALQIDCEISAELLTEENIMGLNELEPCGTGCPKPVFCLNEVVIDQIGTVSNGRHLRFRFHSRNGAVMQAIFFSGGSWAKKLSVGSRVDIAFQPAINEYKGLRSVQLNVVDLRLVNSYELYDRFLSQQPLQLWELRMLAPSRQDVIDVWRYLENTAVGRSLRCRSEEFCSAVSAAAGERHSIRRTTVCLDILKELGLISLHREYLTFEVRILPEARFNALQNSALYRRLGGK